MHFIVCLTLLPAAAFCCFFLAVCSYCCLSRSAISSQLRKKACTSCLRSFVCIMVSILHCIHLLSFHAFFILLLCSWLLPLLLLSCVLLSLTNVFGLFDPHGFLHYLSYNVLSHCLATRPTVHALVSVPYPYERGRPFITRSRTIPFTILTIGYVRSLQFRFMNAHTPFSTPLTLTCLALCAIRKNKKKIL